MYSRLDRLERFYGELAEAANVELDTKAAVNFTAGWIGSTRRARPSSGGCRRTPTRSSGFATDWWGTVDLAQATESTAPAPGNCGGHRRVE